jgi:DNA-binding beta-propeller fold protein YncE
MKSLAALIFSFTLCHLGAAGPEPLRLTKTIALPDVPGRLDHVAIDATTRRLFLAATANNSLEVVGLDAGARLLSITGQDKPSGVLFLPEPGRILVANGGEGSVRSYDSASYGPSKRIGSLDDADNLRVDARAGRIYVGYAAGALAVIDLKTLRQIGAIRLSGHPESFQLEPHGQRMFVNVPNSNHVAVIDRTRQALIATWPLQPFTENYPMALDEANNRLLIGCRQPARLVVLNTATGKPVADLAIAGDTDDLFYDAKLRRIYVSCGEGFVDVIEQRSADSYRPLYRMATAPGARTSFFSAEQSEFYLAVPAQPDRGAEVRVYKAQK